MSVSARGVGGAVGKQERKRAAGLELQGIGKRLGPAFAIHALDLSVEPGRLFCLLGPSGCGKTTLLKLIAGYLYPDAGRVTLGERVITRLAPEARGIGMVFQHYALFPHLSARDNVAFGLAVRGIGRSERDRRVEAMLDRVGLAVGDRNRRPKTLSGGQQQRVALARALVIEPKLLLLDEPMANLDRRLREQLRDELRDLQRRTGVTTVLVTHDQEEALSLADRIGVMRHGALAQVDTPDGLYARPVDEGVARFVGDANVLAVHGTAAGRWQLAGGLSLAAPCERVAQRVVLRPEHLAIVAPGAGEPATVERLRFFGADRGVDVRLGDGTAVTLRLRAAGAPVLAVGEQVDIAALDDRAWPL